MDFKNIKTFHLIVKYGSFIRAAEEMNYAQSTVTMQIHKLESDLGVELIERGKKIRLTEAGRLFYEQSLQIVSSIERLQSSLGDLQSGEAGHVRIGVTEPTASHRLPAILRGFRPRFPKIELSIEIGSSVELGGRVLRGELDMAICSIPDLSPELYFDPLFDEKFVVLMPSGYSLASQAIVAPTDLKGIRLLITSATCPYRRKLEMVLRESGITPLETMEIGSMTALPYYVEAGLGVALVPEIGLRPLPAGTVMRPLAQPVDMTFGLLSRGPDYPLSITSARVYQYLKQELSGY